MQAIILNLILPLIEQLLPLLSGRKATSEAIALVIRALETAIPLLGQLATTWAPKIKAIIAVLRASPAVTLEQMAALAALDAASDAAFDAAVKAAEEEEAKGDV